MTSLGTEETRRRILNNARAAEWDRLRGEAAKRWPAAGPEELDQRARELQREKLSAAGRKSREVQAARLREAAELQAMLPEIELRLLETLDYIRSYREAGGVAA